MLFVRTRLGVSEIQGIGLFAEEFIPVGTITWRCVDGFDVLKKHEELVDLPPLAREWFKRYAYLDKYRDVYVLCADNARFMNHSNDSNVRPDYNLDPFGLDMAVRDIQAGEELTTNYTLFDKDDLLF